MRVCAYVCVLCMCVCGLTNYKVGETEEEKAKRLRQWEKFLEEDGAAEDKELGTGQTAAT